MANISFNLSGSINENKTSGNLQLEFSDNGINPSLDVDFELEQTSDGGLNVVIGGNFDDGSGGSVSIEDELSQEEFFNFVSAIMGNEEAEFVEPEFIEVEGVDLEFKQELDDFFDKIIAPLNQATAEMVDEEASVSASSANGCNCPDCNPGLYEGLDLDNPDDQEKALQRRLEQDAADGKPETMMMLAFLQRFLGDSEE